MFHHNTDTPKVISQEIQGLHTRRTGSFFHERRGFFFLREEFFMRGVFSREEFFHERSFSREEFLHEEFFHETGSMHEACKMAVEYVAQ